jgi:hypothetical protein
MPTRLLLKATRILLHPITWCLVAQALAFAALNTALGASPMGQEGWVNADTTFPFHLGKDVLVDGYPLSGWQLPIASFLFPDVVLASGLLLACGCDMPAAFALYCVAQFSLLIGGGVMCILASGIKHRTPAIVGILLGGVALTLLATVQALPGILPGESWLFEHSHSMQVRQLFIPQSHAGTAALALWCQALLVWLLRRGITGWRGWAGLGSLAVLAALGGLSNMLFFVYFAGPALLCCLFTWLMGASPRGRVAVLAILAVVSTIGGKLLAPMLLNMNQLSAQALGADRLLVLGTFAQEIEQGLLQDGDLGHWVAVLLVFVATASVGRALLLRWIRCRRHAEGAPAEQPPVPAEALLLSVTAAGSGAMLAIIWGGKNPYVPLEQFYSWATRYWQLYWAAPWPSLGAVGLTGLAYLLGRYSRAGMLTTAMLAAIIAAAVVWTRPPAEITFARWSPPYVRELDALSLKGDGVAGFWSSGLVDLYSRRGHRAYPIVGWQPFHYLGNRHWDKAGAEGPRLTFFITGWQAIDQPEHEVIARLGAPARIVRCGTRVILVYDRPEDADLRDFLVPLAQRKVFLASMLLSQAGQLIDGRRVAREGETQAGCLVYGPYVALPPGQYRYCAQLEGVQGPSDSAVAMWDVGHFVGTSRCLAKGQIFAGQTVVEGTVELTDDPPRLLELRIFYNGIGSIAIRSVSFARINDN